MPVMAEMLGSALVQEAVTRSLSLGFSRREEKASQGHLMERLEMAVSELDYALERAQELPVRHVSVPWRRKIFKRAFAEAMELLGKHKQQAVRAGQGEVVQGVKRKGWILCAKNKSNIPFTGLSTADVRRFEWYADCAGRFVRQLESGCSVRHYIFRYPIVRHLREGKTLQYCLKQGNLLRAFYMWPMFSDDRAMEVTLGYRYEDSTTLEKCFYLLLILRLSDSTDIDGDAIKGLQYLTSEFKLAAECAVGELTLLSNLQDIVQIYGPPWVGIQECHMKHTQIARPDPSCCKGSRHELCANNYVSSELRDIFPEPVIFFSFDSYVPAPEQSSSCSSFHDVGISKSRGSGKPPLVLTAAFQPHEAIKMQDSFALETIGDVTEYRDVTIQQAVQTLKLKAINCFLHQPELTEYSLDCYSKHGGAWFTVRRQAQKEQVCPKPGGTIPEEVQEVAGGS